VSADVETFAVRIGLTGSAGPPGSAPPPPTKAEQPATTDSSPPKCNAVSISTELDCYASKTSQHSGYGFETHEIADDRQHLPKVLARRDLISAIECGPPFARALRDRKPLLDKGTWQHNGHARPGADSS